MAQVQGTPGYLDFPSSIIRSVWKAVGIVEPSNTPLYTLGLSRATNAKPGQSKFEMQHDVQLPLRITLASTDKYSGGSATTTYTSATNASMFQVGAYWRNYTQGQELQVTGVAGSTITLAPCDGSSTVIAASTGDIFEFQFFPQEQGGTIRQAISSVITYPYNATQIFTDAFGVDDTTEKTKLYMGGALAYFQKLAALRHKVQIEYALWYGSYQETTGPTGRRMYTCNGLKNIIQTHTANYPAGALTLDLYIGFLRDHTFVTGGEHGGEEVYCFANQQAIFDLTTLAEGNIRIDAGTIPQYGINFKRMETGFGDVMFIRTPELREPKGIFFHMRPAFFYMQYMQTTRLVQNIQMPNQMQRIDAYITECGPQYNPEEYLSMFSGV